MNQDKKKPQSILIVDDESKNVQLLANLLTGESYEIEAAMSGEEALDWLNERPFDLILMDVMMPGMNGYEVCRKIKENSNLSSIPIIFLTARTETEDIVRGFEAGAVDYVTKPFRTTELLSRVKTHMKIQWQHKELEELNATKDKFFSIIAHDLKSPFITLFNMIELMKDMPLLENPEFQELLNSIREEGNRTFQLLTNLLEWAKTQRNLIEFQPGPLPISETIRSTVNVLQDMADPKNIRIQLNLPEPEFLINGDGNMVSTIFRNLINNAIKFTRPGGLIKVSYRILEDKKVEFLIQDSGIGISEKNIDKLFRIDKKVLVNGTNGEKGTGLGLNLCKEFMNMHNGSISVSSREGEGSTFSIVFNTVS
ncbi:MAG: hybrid sensor histidine kinase/response regulator [Leptospiraceae bacterium]|nr:hybrid sensor histidine kinase/response regulator [Leptospiraceae bacterium]MCP5511438.1 hybrid sensor histidine kinase/response regulator [Leptospiraceae bacterium]